MDKTYQFSIDKLLEHACPSIQSRIRLEILDESSDSDEILRLQALILEDRLVKEVAARQNNDGWLGRDFHGYNSIEAGIRILSEKGILPSNPVTKRAVDALLKDTDRLHLGIGKVGRILDDMGFGGSQRIRATIFAYTGLNDESIIVDEIEKALLSFQSVLNVERISDVCEDYRNKLVFKPGTVWPDIYALRLLAFTESWRSTENVGLMAKAIHKLVALSPMPEIYVRCKSQLIAPGSFGMCDFNPQIAGLDDAGWMMWFHRMEMLARFGVINLIESLKLQMENACAFIDVENGLFNKHLNHHYFRKWGAYSGLMLERDWRSPRRRAYDLSFRILLIFHYVHRKR